MTSRIGARMETRKWWCRWFTTIIITSCDTKRTQNTLGELKVSSPRSYKDGTDGQEEAGVWSCPSQRPDWGRSCGCIGSRENTQITRRARQAGPIKIHLLKNKTNKKNPHNNLTRLLRQTAEAQGALGDTGNTGRHWSLSVCRGPCAGLGEAALQVCFKS